MSVRVVENIAKYKYVNSPIRKLMFPNNIGCPIDDECQKREQVIANGVFSILINHPVCCRHPAVSVSIGKPGILFMKLLDYSRYILNIQPFKHFWFGYKALATLDSVVVKM